MVFALDLGQWTSSTPSAGSWRVHGSLPNQSTCVLWIWRSHSTVSLRESCGVLFGIMVCRAPLFGLFAPCMTRVRVWSLLFVGDVVLLAPWACDLQLLLDRFADECKAAGMKISTSKPEPMVPLPKKGGLPSSGLGGDPAPSGGVQGP